MNLTTTSNDNVINSTRRWVESVVVDLNLCPFARKALIDNRVRFSITEAVTEEQLLDELQDELSLLDHEPTIELSGHAGKVSVKKVPEHRLPIRFPHNLVA